MSPPAILFFLNTAFFAQNGQMLIDESSNETENGVTRPGTCHQMWCHQAGDLSPWWCHQAGDLSPPMKDKALHMLEEEYTKRLKAFVKIEITEVRDEPNERIEREKEAALAKEKEGERALAQIKDNDFVILLDLHGSHWDSETFAEKLGSWQTASSNLTFVIAGSLGPSPALVARANARWKLSDLTFTHLMTRVLVLEQIYRAFMILNGRKYHK